MKPSLSIVADSDVKSTEPKAESIGQRVKRIQLEAKGLARSHVAELNRHLLTVQQTAAEIAEGGDAYPPGVRDLARRLVEDCELRVQTIEGIMGRVS